MEVENGKEEKSSKKASKIFRRRRSSDNGDRIRVWVTGTMLDWKCQEMVQPAAGETEFWAIIDCPEGAVYYKFCVMHNDKDPPEWVVDPATFELWEQGVELAGNNAVTERREAGGLLCNWEDFFDPSAAGIDGPLTGTQFGLYEAALDQEKLSAISMPCPPSLIRWLLDQTVQPDFFVYEMGVGVHSDEVA